MKRDRHARFPKRPLPNNGTTQSPVTGSSPAQYQLNQGHDSQ